MAPFRWTSCFLSCWALVAVPSLCTSGWLLHPCACEHSTEHDHEHENLDGCGHESECSADPCELVVTRLDDEVLTLIDSNAIDFLPVPPIEELADYTARHLLAWSAPTAPSYTSLLDILTSTILLI